MFLQIGMDRARRILRASVHGDGPGAAFILARGEERNKTEQRISGADQANQAALREAITREEFGSIGVAHFRKFSLDFSADGRRAGIGARGDFRQLVFADRTLEIFPELRALVHVQHVENRFLAQEHEAAKTLFVFRRHLHLAKRALRSEVSVGALEQIEFFFKIGGAHFL